MTDAVIIRESERGDLAAVDALLARSYPALLARDYPPSVLVTALPLIARANPALVGRGGYFVAEAQDGAIVGAGGCTLAPPAGGMSGQGAAHVRHVVTDRDHVRRGIGAALMMRVISHARAADAPRLECLSTRTAAPFYAALGFATIAAQDVELRPGIIFAVIRMQLRL